MDSTEPTFRSRPSDVLESGSTCEMRVSSITRAAAATVGGPSCLIVGGGVTAAIISALASPLPHSPFANPKRPAIAELTVVEKARGAGGRMSTTRAISAAMGSRCDSGAQYLTRSDKLRLHMEDSSFRTTGEWYDYLEKNNVLQEFKLSIGGLKESHRPAGKKNYIAAAGMASVAKHLLTLSGATFQPNREVVSLEVGEATVPKPTDGSRSSRSVPSSGRGGGSSSSEAASLRQWIVTFADGGVERFDAAILTMPVPQILALKGDVCPMLEGAGVMPALRRVKYSSRYALVLYFKAEAQAQLAALFPHAARYVDKKENDSIRYVAYDSLKRANQPDTSVLGEPFPTLVVHTSVEFGAMYLDTDPSLVEPVIMEQLLRLAPTLPTPIETKCHRWKFSQVTSAYDGPQPFVAEALIDEEEAPVPTPGTTLSAVQLAAAASTTVGAVMVVDDPPLILAGDAFASSNFEGCLLSGETASSLLLRVMEANRHKA